MINDDNSVFAVTSEGGSQRSLGIRSPWDGFPVWTEDPSKILWTRNGELRVIDVDSGSSEPLGADWLDDWLQVFQFAFSPSGNQVAFQNHGMYEGRRLYIVKSSFEDPVSIPLDREDGLMWDLSWLFWSPSGEEILLDILTSDSGCALNCADSEEYHLLDLASLKLTRLRDLELALEKVERYSPCGFTPDGSNFVVIYYGTYTYYFFGLTSGALELEIGSPLSCPHWLGDD